MFNNTFIILILVLRTWDFSFILRKNKKLSKRIIYNKTRGKRGTRISLIGAHEASAATPLNATWYTLAAM